MKDAKRLVKNLKTVVELYNNIDKKINKNKKAATKKTFFLFLL